MKCHKFVQNYTIFFTFLMNLELFGLYSSGNQIHFVKFYGSGLYLLT